MKYLKKIFENEKTDILFIEEEISSIKDIFTGLSDIGLDIKLNNIYFSVYNFDNNDDIDQDGLNYDDYYEDIVKCGYEMEFRYTTFKKCLFSNDDFSNFVDFTSELKSMIIRVNNILDSQSFIRLDHGSSNWQTILVNFIKNNPSNDDYYYIFKKIISNYIGGDSNFNEFNFSKINNDYYLTLTLKEKESVYLKQISLLKEFCNDYFEEITYDNFKKIDNMSFQLKNPKIKSIKI